MIARSAAAEQAAADYLTRQGLQLVTRNFRCRLGEIDLIMGDGKTLVFVECSRPCQQRIWRRGGEH